jgi:nitrate reductase NapAB chaperone NapD
MKYRACVAGIIVVAEMEAIEETLHTLNQFVDWRFELKEGGKFIVSGYAHMEGEVKEKIDFVEQARQMGRDMVKSLKNS